MRRLVLFTALLLSLLIATGAAQVPQVINYQGKLVDNSGDPVPDAGYQMTFTIYEDAAGTTSRWSSGSVVVDVEDGLFCYALGSAVAFPGDLFEDTLRWLGISVSGDPEILPRTKLTSVAFAYHALRADTAATVEVPLSLSADVTHPGIVYAENTGLGVGIWAANSYSGNYAYMGSLGSGVTATAAVGDGVWGESSDASGRGVYGYHSSGNYGYLGGQTHAGYFGGNVQIDGTAQMTGFSMAGGAADGYVLTSNGAGFGTWQPSSGGGGGGWVDDGSTVRLETSSDQVGIGTSSPGGKLEVFEDIDGRAELVIHNPSSGSNSMERLSFDDENGSLAAIEMSQSPGLNLMTVFNNRPSSRIDVSVAGGATSMSIASTGVGIGNPNPMAALDVSGTAKMTGFSMPTGASNSYVLTSDGAGVGTWQAAPGGIGGGSWAAPVRSIS